MDIELRERTEAHVRVYFEKTRDPEIRAMLPQTAQTVEQAVEDYRKTQLPGVASYGRTIYADGKYAGDIWCYCMDLNEEPNAMLSYCVFEKELWGKGVASEALRQFLADIVPRFGLETVGAFAYRANRASLRVLEKNGFACMETFLEDGTESAYYQKNAEDRERMEFLLLDLDDTILDFHKAERLAIGKTIRDFGVEPTEEILTLYHEINDWHWKQLELGKLTRAEVLENRFRVLFEKLGRDVDAALCARRYEKNLSVGHYFLPGAEEAVEALSKRYRLFLVSNGTASVQKGRMTSANLYRFFEKVFVSQEIGHNKPAKAYFDACFAQIPGFDREKAMIVGDSLSSDIRGGINAGIKTVWVNPEHKDCGDIKPDYEIEALSQLQALLETL